MYKHVLIVNFRKTALSVHRNRAVPFKNTFNTDNRSKKKIKFSLKRIKKKKKANKKADAVANKKKKMIKF